VFSTGTQARACDPANAEARGLGMGGTTMHTHKIGVLISILCGACAGGEGGELPGFGPAIQLGSAAGDDWEPAVAADDSQVYVFWMHIGPMPDCALPAEVHMAYQTSLDGGATWSPPRSIACQAEDQADAQIVVEPTTHSVYTAWMDGNDPNTPIWVSYSDDRGGTWQAPVLATSTSGAGSVGDKDILVVSGSVVCVSYAQLTDTFVSCSPDLARHPFTPVSVSGPPGHISLATGGAHDTHGNLFFAYGAVQPPASGPGPGLLWLARSADGGATWATRQIDRSAAAPVIQDADRDFFSASVALGVIPRAQQATDRLVAVYNKNLTDGAPERIYTAYSDDNGETWKGVQELSSAPAGAWHGFPAIASDARGARAIWMDNRARPICNAASTCGTWRVYARMSADGTTAWSDEIRIDGPNFVTANGITHPYQSADGFSFPYGDYSWAALNRFGTVHVVWGEGESYNGSGSIWFNRGAFP
jgi:hypothetical protein